MNPNGNNTGRIADQIDLALETSPVSAVPSTIKAALASVMLIGPGALTPQQAAAESTHALQSELVHPVVATDSEESFTATDMIGLVDERYHDAINDMSPEYIDSMNPVFSIVMGITDEKDRGRAIRRVVNFFESPEEDSFVQMMERLPGYGVNLTEALVSDLTVFYIAEQTRFGNEISQTLLAVGDLRHMLLTMETQNAIKIIHLNDLRTELETLRSQEGDLRSQEGDLRSQEGDLRSQEGDLRSQEGDLRSRELFLLQEIIKINREIENTRQTIEDIKGIPSAA